MLTAGPRDTGGVTRFGRAGFGDIIHQATQAGGLTGEDRA